MNDGPRTVGDAVVERLRAWGVDRIFGYPGDGNNGLMGALRRADGAVELVQARHEENAALMAVGHAKYTGGVGVVTSTQGPGAVHLLNGLYDAKLDHVPVVAIVGQQATTAIGSEYQQEIDLVTLFSDVASSFRQMVLTPEQAVMIVDRAFRTALATRSPTVVVIPHDVQTAAAVDDVVAHEHGVVPTAVSWTPPRVVPHRDDLQRAADVLNAGERIAVFAGQGVRNAAGPVLAVTDRLQAGLTVSLLGKPWLDESLPQHTGVMGHLGTSASATLLAECDTLLIVGSNDPWTEFYPAPGQARAVQIDLDGRRVGNRYPVEVGLVGDAAETLAALLPLLDTDRPTAWRDRIEQAVRDWDRLAEQRAAIPARPLNPELVVRELSAALPADAQVSVDVGSIVYHYSRQLRLPPGTQAHLSSTLASMGSGLPYGLAAKLHEPHRPLVALVGDGAMQMNGINELVTVADRWRDWADPRFVVLVLHNGDLAEVSWEQRETESEPRFEASQRLPDFPYAGYADLLGLRGIRVDRPADVAAAWREAFTADRPVLIEAIVDADVPLLAPGPAGDTLAEQMRAGLASEGDGGRHAADLLATQQAQDRRGQDG